MQVRLVCVSTLLLRALLSQPLLGASSACPLWSALCLRDFVGRPSGCGCCVVYFGNVRPQGLGTHSRDVTRLTSRTEQALPAYPLRPPGHPTPTRHQTRPPPRPEGAGHSALLGGLPQLL